MLLHKALLFISDVFAAVIYIPTYQGRGSRKGGVWSCRSIRGAAGVIIEYWRALYVRA